MAKITNPARLLPSSAIVKIGSNKSAINISKKTTSLALANKPSKEISDANNKLVKIDSFLKNDLVVSQKKAEENRKKKEKQDFEEAEKKLETPQSKKFKLPGISLPSIGLFERIKRFLFFTALGWLLPKIIEFLPKLEGFAKIIGKVYQFAEGMFGKLFDGFMSLVKFGGDLKDKTIGFIASAKAGVGGNYEKEFTKLENQFNTFVNASIIAGALSVDIGMSAVDEYNKWKKLNEKPPKPEEGGPGGKFGAGYAGRKLTVEELKKIGVKPGSVEGRAIQTEGKKAQRASAKQQRRIRGAEIRADLKKPKPKLSWWQKITGGLKSKLGKLAKPFSKFAGAALPGFGAAVGYMDMKARAKSGDKLGAFLAGLSASLDAFTFAVGAAALASAATMVGIPGAAVLGTAAGAAGIISMAIDAILLIRDILEVAGVPKNILGYYRGGRIVRKYQGGGTTRGGRPVGGRARRTLTPARKKPIKIKPPKSQPGKDVGGEKKIKQFYSKKLRPGDPGYYQRPTGGWLSTLDVYNINKKPDEKIDDRPYKALTRTAKILKDIPLVGGIMGAAVDISLGQKPDARVYMTISSGISYLVESLANEKANLSISKLSREINAFAEGGYIPPSRELRSTYNTLSSGDMLAKVLGPTIDQRVNEAIQSIQKELQKRQEKKEETTSPGQGPGELPNGGGGGPGVESIDMTGLTPEDVDALGRMIQAESGNQSDVGKASIMNVILNRYRLAKAGKGYLPRGKTKDTVTIRDILYAPNQFSPIADGRFDKTSSAAGRSALSEAISAGGNDPEKLKKVLMEKYKLSERDAEYVVVSTAFSNPRSRVSRPFNTKEVAVGNHTFQESPYVRLRALGQRIDASVKESEYSGNLSDQFLNNLNKSLPGITLSGQRYRASRGGRLHAGRDYDLGLNDTFYSRIGGEVVNIGNDPGKYGKYIDIYNKDLNRTERIAEGTTILSGIRIGSIISPGQPVVRGTHQTGVIHYEIRRGKSTTYGVSGTEDPDAFLNSNSYKEYLKKVASKPENEAGSKTARLTPQQAKDLEQRAKSLKPGDEPIVIPGIGSISVKRGPRFSTKKIYHNADGNEITQQQFNDLMLKYKLPEGSSIRSSEPRTTSMQGGGLIAPSKPNRPIPNSFASYETPGGGMMIAIQPIIIEKQVPTSSGGNSMIAFPVPVTVNSNMDLSLSRG